MLRTPAPLIGALERTKGYKSVMCPNSDNGKRESRGGPGIYVALAIALTLLVLILYVRQFPDWLPDGREGWGQFGDYFGGVLNPIFGLGGFIALLFTFYHQREELEKTTKHVELQTRLARVQGFETTFFQLLGLYREVVNDLKITRRKRLNEAVFPA